MFVSKDPSTGRVWVAAPSEYDVCAVFDPRSGIWSVDVPSADDLKDNFVRVRDSKEAEFWVHKAEAALSEGLVKEGHRQGEVRTR
ncbi:MAG: hypothetical protein AAGU21_14235 [Solidesulfovibrio sp.]|uniref:hypothetical protein n=1 Tax=Solidesulfovibrio sp. TaxID=2910990 RepID=UPI002B1F00E2|nr:hypothetical protein [Solidesulfovibrio sp.]MEA4856114.1 hypothetical protein [Solidesulfovibrio sp.]